jgi:heat shock protein HslJ
MKKSVWSTALVIFLFSLTYCNNTKELTTQTEALFRKKWILAELQGQQIPDSTKSIFEFSPGRLSGNTGCNSLSADFVAGKHQTIRFAPEALTKKECPDETSAALEKNFLDALSKSTKWDISGAELKLGDKENTFIKLRSL